MLNWRLKWLHSREFIEIAGHVVTLGIDYQTLDENRLDKKYITLIMKMKPCSSQSVYRIVCLTENRVMNLPAHLNP